MLSMQRVRQFSRRKIESNWDRYEPLNEAQDDDRSSSDIRGADYKSLISQTGWCSTHAKTCERWWGMLIFISRAKGCRTQWC